MASYHELLSKNKAWSIGVGANHLKQINVQDVNIRGNLVVDGSYVYQNVESSIVQDPVMIIGSGPSGEALTSQSTQDRGLAFKYHDGSNEKTGFIGYDINSNKFRFDDDVTIVNNAITSPADPTSPATVVANIDGSLNGQVTTAEQHSISTMPALSSIGSQNNTITAEGNLTVSQGLTVTNGQTFTSNLVDINGGTIDETTIATSNITVGSGKTLNVSDGTLTLADNQISGDKVEGGTINAITITTLGSTTGNITTVNSTTVNSSTVDSTNIEVTNIKAKDGTVSATIADSTGIITIPSSVLTTTDINGGTIDGTTIATSNITVGSGKTLNVSDGTLTLADNQISGDKVEGGTINAITITTLGSTTGNITTVNSTTVNSSTVDSTNIEVTNIKAKDGAVSATIADSTGIITIPSSVLTTTDINGGTIDNTVIGGTTPVAGTFTTLVAAGGTVTSLNVSDGNITNVGNIALDSISADDGASFSFGSNWTAAGRTCANLGTVTTADINGGTIDNTVIGGTNAVNGTFETLTGNDLIINGDETHYGEIIVNSGPIIGENGASIESMPIGVTTPAAGTFTTLTANDQLVVNAGANIIGDTANEITLNVKGVGSQTANILNIELSDGTDKLTVDKDGVTTLASLVATTADINAGTIDNTVIGGTTPAAGTFTTLVAAGGTVTSLNVSDGNITNVGNIALDSISADDGASFSFGSNWTAAGRTCANLGSVTTADINGGTIDSTVIGGTTPAVGTFTTLNATTIYGTLAGGAENSNKVKGTSTNGSITRVMDGAVLVDRLNTGTNESYVDATGYTISRTALENSEFLFKAVLHYRAAYEADQRIKFKIIRATNSSFTAGDVTIYEGPYLGPSNAAGPYNGIANIEVYDDFEGSGASNGTTYYYKIQYQLESANSEYETTSASGILGGNTNRNLLMIQEFAN